MKNEKKRFEQFLDSLAMLVPAHLKAAGTPFHDDIDDDNDSEGHTIYSTELSLRDYRMGISCRAGMLLLGPYDSGSYDKRKLKEADPEKYVLTLMCAVREALWDGYTRDMEFYHNGTVRNYASMVPDEGD